MGVSWGNNLGFGEIELGYPGPCSASDDQALEATMRG